MRHDHSCPYCGAAPENLQPIDGSDRVRCRSCGRKFPDPKLATVRDRRPGEHTSAAPAEPAPEAKPEAQAKAAEPSSKPQGGGSKGSKAKGSKAQDANEANPAAADVAE